MLDITEMMYESLDALTNNPSVPTTPTTPITPITPITPMTPMTPLTPMTPMTPTIQIHYNPSKTSLSSSSSPLHEMEIIGPNDNWNHRHFKIIGDSTIENDRSGRHLSRISSTSSTVSSSGFSILTTNTLNSTISSSPSPTLNDSDSYLDDSDFEKLINFDIDDPNNTNFDVIINVGEEPHIKRFRSSSIILSKRSSYFRTAFSKCWAKKHDDVYLFDKPNISPKVFTAILRYLHFGNIKLERLDISTILDLLIASDELFLEEFTTEIQTYFIHLNSDWLKTKIVPILQCCYSNPTAFSKLMLHTLTVIKRDPTCLLIQNDLHTLSERILNNILKECCNGLDDWAIWQCILKWSLGQEKINEFPHDVKKWKQNEFNMLHELIYKLVEKYVRFSHISRNYFLDKVLPYLNYWIIGSEVEEDANKETVLYYLSHHQRHYNIHHHITHHNNTYTDHHHSSLSSSSSSSSNIILEDSALINHVHALKITYWIQEGHFIPKIFDNTTKSKKNNSNRFNFSLFRKRSRQENSSFISTVLSISTNILTVTTTKSSTKAQINHKQQQQQQQSQQPLPQSQSSTPAAYQFNLLFRMTRDGASAYHDRCMNQGPTLVLTKIKLPSSSSNNRYILVGGYNPIGFNYFSNTNYESNSSTLIFTFGDGESFEKSDVIKMMTSDDNCKEINKDCAKITKDCTKNFKSTPTTITTLSMKKPKKESIFTKVNNLSSISINNYNRFENNTNGLYFGNILIINFHDKFVEFNGGQNFGLIKSDIVECEIFQVKELCY